MKGKIKRLWWLVAFLLLAVALLMYIPAYPPSAAKPGFTKSFYTGIVIRQLEKEIEFTGEDEVILFRDGSLETFKLGSRETAAIIYDCIRNAGLYSDCTHAEMPPEPLPLSIGSGRGNFSALNFKLPLTGRQVRFELSGEDAAALEEYILSIVDEKIETRKAIYLD